MKKLGIIILAALLSGCAINHAAYIKNMEKVSGAEYSKIQVGISQNYTVVKMWVYERSRQHEISNSDDPGVQAQISNYENALYYTDNLQPITHRYVQSPIPDGFDPYWDKYGVADGAGLPEQHNYVALGATIIRDGVQTNDGKDYSAQITDKGDIINIVDGSKGFIVRKVPFPSVDVHPDFDSHYLSDNGRVGVYKSRIRI